MSAPATEAKKKGGRKAAARAASGVRPLHDRVLVRRIEPQEEVRGGIVIPDTAKEKPREAEVIAVGPGQLDENGRRRPLDVNPGDRILIGRYAGTEIKIADEELIILREDDILAVVVRG